MRFNTKIQELYRNSNGKVAIDGRDGSYRVFRKFISDKKYVYLYWAGSFHEAVQMARAYALENKLAFDKAEDYFKFVRLGP